MIKIRVNAIYCDEKERMIWGRKIKKLCFRYFNFEMPVRYLHLSGDV